MKPILKTLGVAFITASLHGCATYNAAQGYGYNIDRAAGLGACQSNPTTFFKAGNGNYHFFRHNGITGQHVELSQRGEYIHRTYDMQNPQAPNNQADYYHDCAWVADNTIDRYKTDYNTIRRILNGYTDGAPSPADIKNTFDYIILPNILPR